MNRRSTLVYKHNLDQTQLPLQLYERQLDQRQEPSTPEANAQEAFLAPSHDASVPAGRTATNSSTTLSDGNLRQPPCNARVGRATHASACAAARVVVFEALPADQLVLCRAFCSHVAERWWTAMCASLGARIPIRKQFETDSGTSLPPHLLAVADDLAATAASLSSAEAAHFIGSVYTSMLPGTYRTIHGAYYTPPAIAAHLIVQIESAGIDWRSARILDPACGGGAFLLPVAQRIVSSLSDTSEAIVLRSVGARLHGYEVDPFAAWLAQVSVDAVLLPLAKRTGRELPLVVSVCDSLRRSPPDELFDLVVGNPPYGRITLRPEERVRFRRSLFGHANLYGLFTDLALAFAKANGVVAYVTPTSFVAGEYFKNLRTLLAREAPPLTLDFIATRHGVFEDVLQETLLATYRRGEGATRTTVSEIALTPDAKVTSTPTGTMKLPSDPSRPWLLPRQSDQRALVKKLHEMRHRLSDWGYTVSTGPLVWNRKKDQLFARPGKNRLPLIWAEAVTPDGQFVWRATKRNHVPYFELRRGDDWLITNQPCVLLQRTTAKEQNRRLIAAALPESFLNEHGAMVVENHLNMIRPIPHAGSTTVVPAITLSTFLNSGAADRAFRCISGSVAVSAYELESLPLPPPRSMAKLTKAIERGSDISRLEQICTELYDG